MTVFFSTTPYPSSQEEGTTGCDFSSTILFLTHPHCLNHLYTKAFPKKRWKWKRKRLKFFMDEPKRTHGSFSVTR